MIYLYQKLSATDVRRLGLDSSDPDIEWITVKGNHIPIKKGLSSKEKGSAIREFFENKGKSAPMKRQTNIAYAGSGERYRVPSLTAVGSGEGHAAHGYGLYYAFNPTTAKRYAKKARTLNVKGKSLEDALADVDIKLQTPPMRYFKTSYETKLFREFEKDPAKGKQMLVDGFKSLGQVFRQYVWGDKTATKLEKVAEFLDGLSLEDMSLAAGQVIKVRLPGNKYLLKEGERIYKQSNLVQEAFNKIRETYPKLHSSMNGRQVCSTLLDELGSKKAVSELLEKHGIKGIKYNGRQDGWGFVMFNPKDIVVEGREDIYGKKITGDNNE